MGNSPTAPVGRKSSIVPKSAAKLSNLDNKRENISLNGEVAVPIQSNPNGNATVIVVNGANNDGTGEVAVGHVRDSGPPSTAERQSRTVLTGQNGQINRQQSNNEGSKEEHKARMSFQPPQNIPNCQHPHHGRRLDDEVSILKQKLRLAEESTALLDRDNDELRLRVSKLASDRLTDDNPSIADLSGENRPTKLAERYFEMYNKEWSNAYESLEKTDKHLQDREVVDLLINLLRTVYDECRKNAHKQTQKLNESILEYTGCHRMSERLSIGLKMYKDERKRNFKKVHGMIHSDDIIGIFLNKTSKTKHVEAYVELAIELCWLMCIQDPPVILEFECKQGEQFDKSVYQEYLTLGNRYNFLVWPPMRLHASGPFLSRGVAEPLSTKSSEEQTKNDAPPPTRNKAFA